MGAAEDDQPEDDPPKVEADLTVQVIVVYQPVSDGVPKVRSKPPGKESAKLVDVLRAEQFCRLGMIEDPLDSPYILDAFAADASRDYTLTFEKVAQRVLGLRDQQVQCC